MQNTLFDLVLTDSLAGFRLHRFELLNWGTFDSRIWKIEPNGFNGLLTGDVGSGKSTLVDALTTLLVPHHRITFNKAAGAESKERTLYSYIRGEYKNEKDDVSQAAKAVTLRDQNTYTVLLAVFRNEGFAQEVTLAQVFWLKDHSRNPDRFFIIAQGPLSISEHFSGFGSDILDLKKRLRKIPSIEVIESFREYSSKFRGLFGIEHEQALELFYQTISMKSVGNLTQFVRAHMLEPEDTAPRIDELRQNFENLNRAHMAILKAKRQIELLSPICEEGGKYELLEQEMTELDRCRDTLKPYFSDHKASLLQLKIENLTFDINKFSQKIQTRQNEILHLENQLNDIKASIYGNGGARLETIGSEIEQVTVLRETARKIRVEYDKLCKTLDLKTPRDEYAFIQNRTKSEEILRTTDLELIAIDEGKVKTGIELQESKKQIDSMQLELTSLEARRSNLPLKNLRLRQAICDAVGVNESELPFVGELLQVSPKETLWEGGAERLLHTFGLSILVPESLYQDVSQYVDSTHLRGKIVYYRADTTQGRRPSHSVSSQSLVKKLQIKPETPFYTWLENELLDRFDYICCNSLDEFRRQSFALTQNGQIKAGGKRHEKDDRTSIHDRSTYILGWSNEAKIQALRTIVQSLIEKAQAIATELASLGTQQQNALGRREYARDILKFSSYNEIHWQVFVRRLQELEDERRSIEETSDILKTLQTQCKKVETSVQENRRLYDDLVRNKGIHEERLSATQDQLQSALVEVESCPKKVSLEYFPKIAQMMVESAFQQEITLVNIEKIESELRTLIQNRFDNEGKRKSRLHEKLIREMQQYITNYPVESQEVDASLRSLSEFSVMLDQLTREDLPRHEGRFKQLLNEGTINSIALLQNHLERGRKEIEEKITAINRSLQEIEYNPGTFIELVHERTLDKEVREFQQDLRACLSHGLFDDKSLYNESRFLQVKSLLDRFNGREEFSELDRRWTVKVTDVRNWYEFSASEKWKTDGTEKEFYSDSSGKSGGQKEKLAYTVLASALAYQFGLEWNATRSASFRFVVIDEAFGRGSDESTRYGLELFKKLNLQLLVVTPLQKIHVIEDYVRSVHFVQNQDGKNSVIRNLSIEEYRAGKENWTHDHLPRNLSQSSQVLDQPAPPPN